MTDGASPAVECRVARYVPRNSVTAVLTGRLSIRAVLTVSPRMRLKRTGTAT